MGRRFGNTVMGVSMTIARSPSRGGATQKKCARSGQERKSSWMACKLFHNHASFHDNNTAVKQGTTLLRIGLSTKPQNLFLYYYTQDPKNCSRKFLLHTRVSRLGGGNR